MERVNLEISWSTLWKIFFFLVMALVLFMSRQIFLGMFLALIISSGLEFLVNFLERRGIPRTVGVILVFLFAISIIIIVIYAVIPLLLQDLKELSASLSGPTKLWLKPILNLQSAKSIEEWITRFSNQFLSSDVSPFEVLSQILGGTVLALSVVVSAFYLSLSRDGVERFIAAVFPEGAEETALRLYERSQQKIAMWFRTQLLLNLIMGVLVWASLTFLGVRNALLLGILAAIFELIPFIGPILSGAAAVVSALATSSDVGLAAITLVVFLIIHQIEAHLLIPLLTGRSVGLHPVIVVVALLVGAEAAGFLGLLIAVPAAAVIQEVVEDWSSKRPRRAYVE